MVCINNRKSAQSERELRLTINNLSRPRRSSRTTSDDAGIPRDRYDSLDHLFAPCQSSPFAYHPLGGPASRPLSFFHVRVALRDARLLLLGCAYDSEVYTDGTLNFDELEILIIMVNRRTGMAWLTQAKLLNLRNQLDSILAKPRAQTCKLEALAGYLNFVFHFRDPLGDEIR